MDWKDIKYPWCSRIECDGCEISGCMNLFDEFVQYFGFDKMARVGSVGSYERLLDGRSSYNNVGRRPGTHMRRLEEVPYCDHAMMFKRKSDGRVVYVNQPYGFNREVLEQWCNERNLIYVICNKKHSFYYPNNTDMILIMSNDTYIKCLDLPGFPYRWEE